MKNIEKNVQAIFNCQINTNAMKNKCKRNKNVWALGLLKINK